MASRSTPPSNAPDALPTQTCRPKHVRMSLKLLLAREARLGRDESGLSQRELAARLATQPSHVARCELGGERNSYSFEQAPMMPPELALRLVRWTAAHFRAQVVEAVEVVHGDAYRRWRAAA